MLLIDELKRGFDTMLHPNDKTKKRMGTGEALKFYYKFSLIPVILNIITSVLVFKTAMSAISALNTTSGASTLPSSLSVFLSSMGIPLLMLIEISSFLVLTPILLLAMAGVLQLIGGLFKMFKGSYSNTLTAVVYGELPGLGLNWLSPIPVIGSIISLVALLWGLYVGITALSNQQRISKLRALGVIIAMAIVLVAIIAVLVLIFVAAFLFLLAPTSLPH